MGDDYNAARTCMKLVLKKSVSYLQVSLPPYPERLAPLRVRHIFFINYSQLKQECNILTGLIGLACGNKYAVG